MEIVLTFDSANHAVKAEQALIAKNINVSVMPFPSSIKAGCGLCLRVDSDALEDAQGVLSAAGAAVAGLYERRVEGGRSAYIPYRREASILPDCAGGCGAKIAPGELSGMLSRIPRAFDGRLLVGYDSSDDAAVYRLDGNMSLISTLDFFPPMVDDPRVFGRIAAANALSDVYAMGGRPVLALNLLCAPQDTPKAVLAAILAGGSEKIREAGAALGGGHSIYDSGLKYGLAVNGLVETDKIIRNNTPGTSHSLILTKPLGVGIIMAAARAGEADASAIEAALDSMQRLNKYAAHKMAECNVSACTDVTGFGLLAHLAEMCGVSVSAELFPSALPLIPQAVDYANEYLLTAAGQRNREHLNNTCDVSKLPFATQELLFDPQTSGGLLICVDSAQAEDLLNEIRADDPSASIIGRIIPRGGAAIVFKE